MVYPEFFWAYWYMYLEWTLMKVLESAPSGRQTNNNMSGFGTGLLY